MYQNLFGNPQNWKQNQANKSPQNPNMNKPNGNQKNIPNKKYADFEIQTFFNNENNTGFSAKDMQLKAELETITNEYMGTFNNINELSKKFSQGNDNMYKTNMVQKDLEQIEYENANEYGNFIGQLFDITKNASVTNLTYDIYKKNPSDGDQRLKKIIGDFKYDVILGVNKNTSQNIYNKLKNFVYDKKGNSNYKYNNNSNNNYNQNKNYGPAPSQNNNNYNYQNSNNNPNGNNYYNNNYKNGGNYGNNYNYNQRNGDNYGNNQYKPPNYGNNYNYNNYSAGKMRVKFIVNGREIYREFDPNGSGDELFMVALGEKNNPRVYYKGSLLARDYLRGVEIINVFGGGEPTLNIY